MFQSRSLIVLDSYLFELFLFLYVVPRNVNRSAVKSLFPLASGVAIAVVQCSAGPFSTNCPEKFSADFN